MSKQDTPKNTDHNSPNSVEPLQKFLDDAEKNNDPDKHNKDAQTLVDTLLPTDKEQENNKNKNLNKPKP